MKEKNGISLKLIISAVIFILSMVLCQPVVESLSSLFGPMFDWSIPLRLLGMISGLVALAELLHICLNRWSPKSSRGKTAFTLFNSAARYVFGLLGLMWALAILGVDVQALLAGAGVVALIIGFGAESLIADVITGIFMIFEHQYEVGDIIVIGDFRGTVTQIGIRTTSVTDSGGNVQIINNSDIRNIINRSNDNSFAVCDIAIPYQGHLRKAEAVLEKMLPQIPKEYPGLFKKEPEYAGVQQLDISQSALLLRISAEVAEKDIYKCQRILNRTLLLAFEDAGISSPVSEVKITRE